jgi:hypothetical protein
LRAGIQYIPLTNNASLNNPKFMSKINKFSISVLTALAVFFINNSLSAENYIGHISVRYEEEVTFKRISEYFTNKENHGFRVITRSDENERAGMYWILSLQRLVSTIPPGSTLFLQYYPRGDANPKSHSFKIDTQRNSTAIFAGITGKDWPNPDQAVDAWKIELRDASGQVLESKQSFLWEQP